MKEVSKRESWAGTLVDLERREVRGQEYSIRNNITKAHEKVHQYVSGWSPYNIVYPVQFEQKYKKKNIAILSDRQAAIKTLSSYISKLSKIR